MTSESAGAPGSRGPTVRVTATGSAPAVPDEVRVDLAVEATAPTVGDALRAASAGVDALRAVLDEARVPVADRRTTALQVHAAWDPATSRPDGHTASYGLTVVVRELDAAGLLVQRAGAAVGDLLRVRGFGLSVRDPRAALAQARRAAVEACRAQAEQLADAAGARLGVLQSLVEGGDPWSPDGVRSAVPLSAHAEAGLPVHGGEQQLSVAVTATWALAVGPSTPA